MRLHRLFAAAALLLALASPVAHGASLHAGDVLVASTVYGYGAPYALWRLDPVTRDTTRLSTGGLLSFPSQLALSPDGGVLVADWNTGLVRIDPVTGAQQLLASTGTLGGNPGGVVVTPAGQVFMSLYGGSSRVVELTTAGQVVRTVTAGLSRPLGMTLGPSGELYVAEWGNPPPSGPSLPYGSILRVDPASGAQSVLASLGVLYGPQDLALTPSGWLYAANGGGLSGRNALFTRTRLSDGFTELDPTVNHLESFFLAASGTEDPWMNYCSPIGFTCYSPMVAPRSQVVGGVVNSPWLEGPMIVVPAGAVPVRRGTWGELKVRYR
jgi:DNA-binding beta-propeller fold protein YncE